MHPAWQDAGEQADGTGEENPRLEQLEQDWRWGGGACGEVTGFGRSTGEWGSDRSCVGLGGGVVHGGRGCFLERNRGRLISPGMVGAVLRGRL